MTWHHQEGIIEMALKNNEKAFLRHSIKKSIDNGDDMQTVILSLVPLGFKKATIRQYYKAFSQ